MSILPKEIYTFNEIPVIVAMTYFTELEKEFRIHKDLQKTQNSQNDPKGMMEATEGNTISDLEAYFKAEVIKTV